VWNLETGQTIGILCGHTRAVRALQFDEVKLITGSMDRTLRVWNWRTGVCVRVLEGHTEGVVSLTFDADILASGSVDTTVKVWNLRKGDCFTLRGHEDWVNGVKIWDPNSSHTSTSPSIRAQDTLSTYASEGRPNSPIDTSDLAGKMLFSASDDCTIRLWDLRTRACIRQFKGHVGQVQSIKMIFSDVETARRHVQQGNGLLLNDQQQRNANSHASSATPTPPKSPLQVEDEESTGTRPLLISCSLDNTLKLWDVETGQDLMTYFGHIEGVWAVASDKLRLVSASHDRTIKVRLPFSCRDIACR
jgi:F-box/WD-40 domain protein MET30